MLVEDCHNLARLSGLRAKEEVEGKVEVREHCFKEALWQTGTVQLRAGFPVLLCGCVECDAPPRGVG